MTTTAATFAALLTLADDAGRIVIARNDGGGIDCALYLDADEQTVELGEADYRIALADLPDSEDVRRWIAQGFTD